MTGRVVINTMDDPQAGTQTRRIRQPKVLEPGPRAQEVSNLDSSWTTTLPEDLLEEQATSQLAPGHD